MITTDRLILRPPRDDDDGALLRFLGDAEVMRFIGTAGPRNLEQIHQSLAKRHACLAEHGVTLWTVELRDPAPRAHRVVGDCGLLPIDWEGPDWEIAYRFARDAWGHGYATEAARATISHAWDATDLAEITGLAYTANTASCAVLTKAGFEHVGTTDQYYNSTLEFPHPTAGRVIETDRLILRTPRVGDAEPLMDAFGDPETTRYIGGGATRAIEQVREGLDKHARCLADHGVCPWTIVLGDTGAVIGDCGLQPIGWEGPGFELGYIIRRDHWGNGYATEACAAALVHAWGATGLDEVIALVRAENGASRRVVGKLGFAHHGPSTEFSRIEHELYRLQRPGGRPTP